MTGSIRTLIIVLTSSLFIATQSFAADLDSSDMDFAFGNSEQSTINPLGGELALLSPEEMLATEGEFVFAAFALGALFSGGLAYLKNPEITGAELLNAAFNGGIYGVLGTTFVLWHAPLHPLNNIAIGNSTVSVAAPGASYAIQNGK